MKNAYKKMILQAVENCHDLELLDLVWKILIEAEGAPSPDNTTQEVKYEDNKSHKGVHRIIPVQVLRRAEHSSPDGAKMGDRWQQVPGVCGGADSLQSAA